MTFFLVKIRFRTTIIRLNAHQKNHEKLTVRWAGGLGWSTLTVRVSVTVKGLFLTTSLKSALIYSKVKLKQHIARCNINDGHLVTLGTWTTLDTTWDNLAPLEN